MKSRYGLVAAAAIIFAAMCRGPAAAAEATSTAPAPPAGIVLDAPWKAKIWQLAVTKFKHPAWGWQHSARNYLLAKRLAAGDRLKIDDDVLFAASFLHDMAAFPPYVKPGEHGDVAAQESGAVLRAAGFPMSKLAAVQAAERGHMYYSDPGSRPEAVVLHDADSLDFLGAVGAARMIALTGEKAPDFTAAVRALRSFVRDIPARLRTKTAKTIGRQRAAELSTFLDRLDAETFGGTVR